MQALLQVQQAVDGVWKGGDRLETSTRLLERETLMLLTIFSIFSSSRSIGVKDKQVLLPVHQTV